MKHIYIFLCACTFLESVRSYPSVETAMITEQKAPIRNLRIMSSLPDDHKNLIIKQLRNLCLMKPKETGDQWTLGLKRSILRQVSLDEDSRDSTIIKKYLTDSIVNEAVSHCDSINRKSQKQTDNRDIFDGLQGILTNVFNGNLVGVVDSPVGVRSPENVQNMMSSIMRSLLENINSAQNAMQSSTSNVYVGDAIGDGLRPLARN